MKNVNRFLQLLTNFTKIIYMDQLFFVYKYKKIAAIHITSFFSLIIVNLNFYDTKIFDYFSNVDNDYFIKRQI